MILRTVSWVIRTHISLRRKEGTFNNSITILYPLTYYVLLYLLWFCISRHMLFVCQLELKELHKHNIESKDFEALPADIKHEILTELKDAGRKTDWACINSMPKVPAL